MGIPVTKADPSDETVVSRLRVAHFTACDSEDLERKVNRWFDNNPSAVVEELHYSSMENEFSVLILYRTMPGHDEPQGSKSLRDVVDAARQVAPLIMHAVRQALQGLPEEWSEGERL